MKRQRSPCPFRSLATYWLISTRVWIHSCMHFCRRTFARLSEKWCGVDQLRRTTFWPTKTPSRHAQAPGITETAQRVLISCKKCDLLTTLTRLVSVITTCVHFCLSVYIGWNFFRRKRKKKLLVKCWLLRESSQKTCKQFRGMKSEGKADHRKLSR